jgi:hypothetical protein
MENNFDIIKLIEKNPITRLTKDYQNRLINKIKSKFPNQQQQLFVASFYCYLNYHSKNDFVVDFDNIWKWIGFTRKDNAKRLLEKYFIKDIDFKILLLRSEEQDFKNVKNLKESKEVKENSEKEHGGHNKEKIMMTVNTFKKFCLKADTKKSDEIHDYYINLEDLLHETINEETNEMKDQLLIKENEIKNNKLKAKMERHKLLIEKLRTKKCAYVAEIEENRFIKIGSTKNIDTRIFGLLELFGNCIFLEVFECDNYREVEEDILNDPTIKKHLYKESINNHNSKEVVELSDEFNYEQLLTIVKKYVNKIYTLSPEQLLEHQKLELEKQKVELEKKKLDYDFISKIMNNDKTQKNKKKSNDNNEEITKTIKEKFSNILQNIEKNIEELDDSKNAKNIKNDDNIPQKQNVFFNPYNDDKIKLKIGNNSLKGRKIQKIDPKNLKHVVKVYQSIGYVLRDTDHKGFQSKSLQDALNNHKIYRDYRWRYVEENEDENNCEKVQPTFEYKHSTSPTDCIIELNATKSEITNSFPTRGFLSKELKISGGKLLKIISRNLIHNEHYYIELNKCPQDLLDKYDKPLNRHTFKNAKKIKQINPITKQTVIFNSLSDLYRKYGYTGRAVMKAIEEKVVYHGHLWEYYKD